MQAHSHMMDMPRFHWLRSRNFDTGFIGLTALAGLVAAGISLGWPGSFALIVTIDLWMLGYHHVISTYTRIAFDRKSAREHEFLVFKLPFLVLGATLLLAFGVGAWAIPTVYFYWQWFHYTRQSYGVSRHYLARSGRTQATGGWVDSWALYAVPVAGILHRSAQAPATFLDMDLRVLPTPEALASLSLWMAAGLVALQFIRWAVLYRRHALPCTHALYMLSHHLMFAVGYIFIDNINIGWLAVNIWHNSQYIAFVWHQNARRFEGGVHPEHRLISILSQPGKVYEYLVVCLLITLGIYMFLQFLVAGILQSYTVLSLSLIAFMTLNFHHYVVDSIIWRRKKKSGAA